MSASVEQRDLQVRIAHHGAWRSPVSAALVGEAGYLFGQLAETRLTSDGLFWLEARADEDGRTALLRQRADGVVEEVGPPGVSVRTRVHEYGGGAYAVHAGAVWISSDDADRILRIVLAEGTVAPVTPPPLTGTEHRYADLQVTPDGRTLVAVRETHDGAEVRNELVALPTDGSEQPLVLASGRDFYASPRISPDGRRLAFLSWDHPGMPWDGSELTLATFAAAGGLTAARVVAGSRTESIFQPTWSPDGTLHLASDRSGWWSLYRLDAAEGLVLVAGGERELGVPQWRFGLSTFAFLDDGTICCIARENGTQRLGVVRDGEVEDLGLPCCETMVPALTAIGDEIACVAATPERAPAVIRHDVRGDATTVVRTTRAPALDSGLVSRPQRIAFESDGRRCFMNFYPPANPRFAPPPGELPPLIVNAHSGPTSAAFSCLDLGVQFWTSRGYAYADVDYGGSAGLGRAYRRRLQGRWGEMDVRDVVNAAAHLAHAGLVDPRRHAIRGMSAGGYTTLRALTVTDAFAAGASYFGIADMALMARHTHKFESHYLDGLLGRDADMTRVYAARSPLNAAERVSVPLALLQGEDDRVVAPEQATLMAEALRARGVPVTLLLFPGEEHGFRRAETIAAALDAEQALYEAALGVRS